MSAKRKKNIKFLTLYNSFSESEKSEFHKFLKSNQNDYGRNYDKIISSLKVNETGVTDIEGTNSGVTRWNRFSELYLLAEKFLVLRSVKSNDILNSFLLLKEFDQMGLDSFFNHKYKEINKKFSKEPVINFDTKTISQIETLNLNHIDFGSRPKNYDKKIISARIFNQGIYLIELLEMLINTLGFKKDKTLNSDTIDEVIFSGINFKKILVFFESSANSPDKLYHIIKFLYNIYLSFIDLTDKSGYILAKKIFFKDLKFISKEKREDFYIYLLNYNIELKNNNIPGADEELFYLVNRKLKEGLNRELTSYQIPSNNFRNFILMALNLKKFSWVNKFINEYGPTLPVKTRVNSVLIGKSFLAFEMKNYILCKELLSQINRKNPYSFVDVSVLKLKVLYELKEFDDCHNEIKKFNEYLRKKRSVRDLIITNAKEFTSAFSLLLKLNQKADKKSMSELQYAISDKISIGKKWLTLKMNEIKL